MDDTGMLRQLIRELLTANMRGSRRFEVPVVVRYGDNINGRAGEHLKQDEAPKAACVLIVSDDGKVLSVSRKDDPLAVGLPGGKVDQGETAMDAAARELKEETGLEAVSLSKVFTAFDGSHVCTTYAGKIRGKIDTDETGVVAWVEPYALLHGPFADYNRALFKKLGWKIKAKSDV